MVAVGPLSNVQTCGTRSASKLLETSKALVMLRARRLLPLTCLATAMSHCTFLKNRDGLHQSTEVQQWQGCLCPALREWLGLTALSSVWRSFHGAAK